MREYFGTYILINDTAGLDGYVCLRSILTNYHAASEKKNSYEGNDKKRKIHITNSKKHS